MTIGSGRIGAVLAIAIFLAGSLAVHAGGVAAQGPVPFGSIVDSLAARPDALPAGGPLQSALDGEDLWSGGLFYEAGTNSYISSIIAFAGQVVIVGSFESIGADSLRYVASWDGERWHPMGDGLPNSAWGAAVYQGQLFAGAYRWDGSTWTNVLQTDGAVYAMQVWGDDLYVAGDFTHAAGQPVSYILRWDGTAAHPVGGGVDSRIYALAAGQEGLYAAGTFNHAGGSPAARVALWDGAAWHPLGDGIGTDYETCCNEYGEPYYHWTSVEALAAFGSDLFAGGPFTTAGGDSSRGFARWDGSTWHDLAGTITGRVYSLLPLQDQVIAAGSFWRLGTTPALHVASWDGNAWHAVGPGLGAPDTPCDVHGVAMLGDQLLAIGCYTGCAEIHGPAFWDGSSWHHAWSVGLGLDGEVRAILPDGDRLIVGGGFMHAGELTANGIAEFDGEQWIPYGGSGCGNVSFLSGIYALERFNGDVIAAGMFGSMGGLTARNVARWDGQAWHAMGDGLPAEIGCLAVHGGVLYAGTGTRWSFDYNPRVFRWDGTSWQCDIAASGGSQIGAMISYGGQLVVGGTFSTANGQPASRILSWDGQTVHSLGTGISGYMVNSLAIQGDDLLVGGGFYTAGGVAAPYIARWDGTSWSAVGSGFGGGADHYGVYNLLVRGDQIIASGNFTSSGTQAVNRVAIWNGSEWRGLAGGIGKDIVYASALLNGDLYVGGAFTQAGTKVSDNFARWRQAGLPVLLSGLSARRDGAAARLSWHVSGEIRLHVWREIPGSPRVRLTGALLAGGDQEFVDANAPLGAVDYWLQDAATDAWHGPAHLAVAPVPASLSLFPVAPNPFNPRATIRFALPQAGHVRLSIYDQRGRRVRSLVDGPLPAGEQSAVWDGQDAQGRPAPSGAYIVRLVTQQGTRSSKLALAR